MMPESVKPSDDICDTIEPCDTSACVSAIGRRGGDICDVTNGGCGLAGGGGGGGDDSICGVDATAAGWSALVDCGAADGTLLCDAVTPGRCGAGGGDGCGRASNGGSGGGSKLGGGCDSRHEEKRH